MTKPPESTNIKPSISTNKNSKQLQRPETDTVANSKTLLGDDLARRAKPIKKALVTNTEDSAQSSPQTVPPIAETLASADIDASLDGSASNPVVTVAYNVDTSIVVAQASGTDWSPGLMGGERIAQAGVEAAAGSAAAGAPSSAAAGAGAAAGGAGVAAGGAAALGASGMLAALGVGVAAAAAVSNSGGGAATTTPAAAAPQNGSVIDGYLKGATVFIDKDGDGILDADEPSTTSADDGSYSLPGGVAGNIVAFGGTDIDTNLSFKGVLKAPAGSTVVTPLTTMIADLTTSTFSAAQAKEKVLKALGLGALNSQVDLLNFDPVLAAAGSNAEMAAVGLQIHKAGVTVATMVSDMTEKVRAAAGASDSSVDNIAGDVFVKLSAQLSDDALSAANIGTFAGTLVDTLVNTSSLGGIDMASHKNTILQSKTALVESAAGLSQQLANLDSLSKIGKVQKSFLSAVKVDDAFPQEAYLVGTAGRAVFREVITVGEQAANGYAFNGIPDGIGVLDNGDGTLRVLVNHEFGNTAGAVRAHGSKGAYISELVIDKASLTVVSGKDFLQSTANLYLSAADGTSWSSGVTTAFNRFCSGDLAELSAFKAASTGYDGRIYLTGEEAGAEGRAFAHVLSGADAGKVYELPSLGNMSFENAVANGKSGSKTVVAALDDATVNGQVYIYVGNKSATGNAVEKAGLAGGKLFGVKVGTGAGVATEVGALSNAGETGLGLSNGATQFSLVDLGDVKAKTGAEINTASVTAGVTNFLRPEDGAWSLDGKTFYFVTTASVTTASRLWALEFTDATNPEAGGTIKMLLDGSEGQIMMDNLTVANDGTLILQEDPGSNDRLAKIWKYTPGADTLVELAQHDPVLFSGANKLTNDEESSGVVDVTSFFAGVAGYDTAKYNYFMVADQIHKAITDPVGAVEMGQLTVMATAKAVADPQQAFPQETASYLLGTEGRAVFREVITVGEQAANGYAFNGIPDGIGVLDNGDGTLRVLVNHEFGNTAGAVRAHGSKGAYISELVIDKASLTVVSGKDFLQSTANLYLSAADGTSWSSGVTTAFNRFCSGDLAELSAFKAASTGYDGRIYLTGEEAGAEGRAFAHVLSGADAGKVYELPSLGNMSFENAVANGKSGSKTVVAALDDATVNGQVYIYVGNKSATGNAVEKAGLAGGKLFGVKVGTGAGVATEVGALSNAGETGLGLSNGATQFSLVDLGDVKAKTGAEINTASVTAGVTNFLRPEDGAWSLDGKTFYFVTTASVTTASRLWALEFTDAASPEAGGTIKMLLDGSEGQIMMDNLTVANDGTLILQEDPGSNDRLAKIWKYTPGADTLVELAQHDPVLFSGANKLTNDEESSGAVDVTSFFAGVAGYDTAKYNYFMVADQIHKAITDPVGAVEMGQLTVMATAKAVVPTLGFSAPGNTFDLSNYTQTGRYALPAAPLAANKLAHEASGVTYNKDTDTLFVVGDGGTSVTQVTKQGVLVDSMALATGTSAQGTYFYDPEGIAYIGGGKFVFVEERDREFNEFTYVAGATLGESSGVRTVKLGTTIGNIGIEGLTLDPATGGYIAVKEATPLGVFQTTVNFATGTASNGSATTVNSIDLFDPAKTGLATHSDVFALSNVLASSAGDYSQLLILSAGSSAASGKVIKIDRAGNIQSSFSVAAAAKNEGITMDASGNIYVVGEEGGGSTEKPELLVFSPTVDRTAVGLGSNLYLSFNHLVAAGTGSFILGNGAGDTRSIAVGDTTQVSFSGNSVTINPATDLVVGSTYTLTYAAGVLKDAQGGNLAALSGNTLNFATITDTLAPTLVSTSPVDDATGVTSNHIVLTFSEAVVAGTGNIIISGTNGSGQTDTRTIAVGDITQVTISATTVDINPGADLLNGYAYNVQFASGVIKDAAGNAFAGITTASALNYTKGTVVTPKLLITEVNSNATPADFFEIYNYGATTVDLSGWKWDDDSASFTDPANATFASGTTIAAGQRLVVAASTDAAAFKTAWGLGSDVATVALGGPGLGSADAVVLFNASGSVVSAINYSTTSKTATDGSVIAPSVNSSGTSLVVGHAGVAFGGTATTSAVWDGVSTSSPTYKAAAVGVDGGFAQTGTSANIGSPGRVGAPLAIGDVLFVGANGDPTDAFAFMLTRSVVAGTEIGFTDRNYSNTTGFAGITNESAMIWTADQYYAAGTIVTIQPDQLTGSNPIANKGTVTGVGGGISTTAETLYAFKGSIANLLTGGAGEITVDLLLSSLNVGGAAAGDVPTSIASKSLSFAEDNTRYTGPLDTSNMSSLATQILTASNWTGSDTTVWPVTVFP